MRQALLLVMLTDLLCLVGCVARNPEPVEPSTATTAPVEFETTDETPPAKRFPDSPFLSAVVRAGLLGHEWEVVDSIDLRGTITVDETPYLVLYVNRYLWLSSYNQRGGSYWLICDAAMRPVWMNPDYGGSPGICEGNTIQVNLTDKFFELGNADGNGDFLTFTREGDHLTASIDWKSDETRIAHALNWRKWRDDSHEPDEEVTKLVPVAGHPSWRIVLTVYAGITHQGCASLVDINADGEFGVREIDGVFADQTCVPTDAGTIRPLWCPYTFAWLDWNCRSAEYRTVGVIRGENWIELGTVSR
ncbi:MAG: hypothetical protein IPK87_06020 [Planctomycetes bacterium]|nr:hypothetical protein [Planctomycetota bacterium]